MTAGWKLPTWRGWDWHRLVVEKLTRMGSNSPPKSVAQDGTRRDSGASPRSENGGIPDEKGWANTARDAGRRFLYVVARSSASPHAERE